MSLSHQLPCMADTVMCRDVSSPTVSAWCAQPLPETAKWKRGREGVSAKAPGEDGRQRRNITQALEPSGNTLHTTDNNNKDTFTTATITTKRKEMNTLYMNTDHHRKRADE